VTADPVNSFATNDYCNTADVTARMYSGQGLPAGAAAPTDPTRDGLIGDEITSASRDFDQEVWGAEYPGLFSWRLETRLFSGLGDPLLWIAPVAVIIKVEIDATPGQPQSTWQDITVEISQRTMGLMPIRGYPKTKLFRQNTFYMDPFKMGNVRITAIWGIVVPDPAATQPNEDWEDQYLDGITTTDPANGGVPTLGHLTPQGGGWWSTPADVRKAVASWVVHRFQAAKTGYGVSSGTGAGKTSKLKTIPDDVQRVINRYKGEHGGPKFALVANDGSDVDGYPAYRWGDWQSYEK